MNHNDNKVPSPRKNINVPLNILQSLELLYDEMKQKECASHTIWPWPHESKHWCGFTDLANGYSVHRVFQSVNEMTDHFGICRSGQTMPGHVFNDKLIQIVIDIIKWQRWNVQNLIISNVTMRADTDYDWSCIHKDHMAAGTSLITICIKKSNQLEYQIQTKGLGLTKWHTVLPGQGYSIPKCYEWFNFGHKFRHQIPKETIHSEQEEEEEEKEEEEEEQEEEEEEEEEENLV